MTLDYIQYFPAYTRQEGVVIATAHVTHQTLRLPVVPSAKGTLMLKFVIKAVLVEGVLTKEVDCRER